MIGTLAVLAAAVACSPSADYDGTAFACDPVAPSCPGGMACIEGVCGAAAGDRADAGVAGRDDAAVADAGALFADDFGRPDGADLGNGWTEKTGAGFELQGGEVAHTTGGIPFQDRVAVRPPGEDGLDFEVSIEVVFSDVQPLGSPQLHLRTQRSDLLTAGSITSYVVYIDNDRALVIDRMIAGQFTGDTRVGVPLPTVGDLYRLRARITGTDPVTIIAWWEHWFDGGFNLFVTTDRVDDDSDRIRTPGAVGFSAHTEPSDFVYDTYRRESL